MEDTTSPAPQSVEYLDSLDPPEAEKVAQPDPGDKPQEEERKNQEAKTGFQKRIDELTWRARENERLYQQQQAENQRLYELLQKGQPKAEAPNGDEPPRQEQYEDYGEYLVARAEWAAEQKANARIADKIQELQRNSEEQRERTRIDGVMANYQKQVETAQTKYPDFFQAIDAAANTPMHQAALQAVIESEQGADLAYYLAKNPKEAARISALQPQQIYREIGRLEAKLSATPAPISKAPAPIDPINSGGNSPQGLSDNIPMDEWLRRREAQLKRKR